VVRAIAPASLAALLAVAIPSGGLSPSGALAQERTTAQAPMPASVALFNTAGNLGFATIRAAYSPPDEPLPQAVADWTIVDYTNAQRWGGGVASCISFDLSRFENAASLVRSTRPSARQMFQLVDQMHRDYRTAVQRSTCSFGLASMQDLDVFYNGALFMGFATARASFFSYSTTTTPPQVAQQIVTDLGVVRSALPVFQKCIGPTTAVENQMQSTLRRLGTVPGKDSYLEVAGIYTAIEAALKNSTCGAPIPSQSSTPPPSNMCQAGGIPPPCAEACRGSTVLLGVVSGGPDCQACIARVCR
jgi:hypothetical protein